MGSNEELNDIHPLWLRIIHWANAFAIIVLILSGWRIYNATKFLGFKIPKEIVLGSDLAHALRYHFAAMWILLIASILYLLINLVFGRFPKQFGGISIKGIWQDFRAALSGKLPHDDISKYNMVQKLAYISAIFAIIIVIMSGLVLWKSVQFPILRTILGGYEAARYIHFGAMTFICAFIIIHVVMALSVPKTIKAMIWGR